MGKCDKGTTADALRSPWEYDQFCAQVHECFVLYIDSDEWPVGLALFPCQLGAVQDSFYQTFIPFPICAATVLCCQRLFFESLSLLKLRHFTVLCRSSFVLSHLGLRTVLYILALSVPQLHPWQCQVVFQIHVPRLSSEAKRAAKSCICIYIYICAAGLGPAPPMIPRSSLFANSGVRT